MPRIACIAVAFAVLAGCSDQPAEPTAPALPQISAAALGGTPVELPSDGSKTTIFANAISPRGWILGVFYGPTSIRSQSWDPADLSVATVTDPGWIYSGTDSHGDVTAYQTGVGSVIYLADPITGGAPYTVVPLPLPQGTTDPGNWIAEALNDDHVVVGHAPGPRVLFWPPVARGGRAWLDPIDLPLPQYPGGLNLSFTQPDAITNTGLVVGSVTEKLSNGPLDHPWLWRVDDAGGTWSGRLVAELPRAPKYNDHRPMDVNEAGVIAGYVRSSNLSAYPILWFPNPDGGYTRAPTILTSVTSWNIGLLNSCGWLAFTGMGRKPDGFLWNGTTLVTLPRLPGAVGGRGYDVNDLGNAVGMARFQTKASGSWGVAVLWRGAVPACGT